MPTSHPGALASTWSERVVWKGTEPIHSLRGTSWISLLLVDVGLDITRYKVEVVSGPRHETRGCSRL